MEINSKKQNRKSFKKKTIVDLTMIVAIFIFLNYISSYFFFRVDLTNENRYTIAPEKKKILKD